MTLSSHLIIYYPKHVATTTKKTWFLKSPRHSIIPECWIYYKGEYILLGCVIYYKGEYILLGCVRGNIYCWGMLVYWDYGSSRKRTVGCNIYGL